MEQEVGDEGGQTAMANGHSTYLKAASDLFLNSLGILQTNRRGMGRNSTDTV